MSDSVEPARDLERRVSDLERLVAGLSAASTPTAEAAATPEPGSGSGMLTYGGSVDLAGQVNWTIRYHAESTMGLPTEPLAAVFAALGHPTRLEIVRLLLRGNASVTTLQQAGDFGTTGQLYHHLKILTGSSVVTKIDRNEYGIAASHVVPALIAMLAAGDLSGSL